MKTYTVKNHNDVIVYRGKSAADAAQEKRDYEHQTGNFCTVELAEKEKELTDLNNRIHELKRIGQE